MDKLPRKKIMLHQLKKLGVAASAILLSATAQSAVIEYTSGFSADNYSNYATTTGNSFGDAETITANRTLQRFDSSLGTLTGVNISFTSNWQHYTYASAQDTSAKQYVAGQESYSCGFFNTCYRNIYRYTNDTFVNSTSFAQFTVQLLDPFRSVATTYDYNYGADCSRSYTGATNGHSVSCSDYENDIGNSFNGNLNLSMFDLSDFTTGGGNDNYLNFNFTNYASVYGTCDNNDLGDSCTASSNAYWNGQIKVSYEYTEVSEPETLALLSFGLVGLAFVRRRKAKNQS